MTSPTSAHLVPSARPNGLLSVLRDFPAGTEWERGVDVLFASGLAPERVDICSTAPETPQGVGEAARFEPVQIRQGVFCSAMGSGRRDVIRYADEAAGITFAFALSAELVTGSATGNPSLSDGTDVGDAATAVEAICLVEGALETRLYGRQGVVHIPVGLACDVLGYAAYRDRYQGRDVWRTMAGNLIAVHGTGSIVYGSGEIWGAWVREGTKEWVERSINRVEAWADTLAIAMFDPATAVYVNVSGS